MATDPNDPNEQAEDIRVDLDEPEVDLDQELDVAQAVYDDSAAPVSKLPPPPPGSGPVERAPPCEIEPAEFALAVPTSLDEYLDRHRNQSAEERAAKLQTRLEGAPKAIKGELAYELGELFLGEEIGDEARAVKSYGVALRADPSLRANLWAIRRIFYRRGLWPNLVKLIGAELRFVESDRERADLELERGLIHEDHLDDGEAAKASYARAVAHDKSYRHAWVALERRSLIDNDRTSLALVWRNLADLTVDGERKQIYLLDLARLLSESSDPGVFEILDEAAKLPDLALVSAERIRAARRLRVSEQMVIGLEELVASQLATLGPAGLPPPTPRDPSSPPDPTESVRLTVIAARRRQALVLLRELDDQDRAWAALEQALAARPGDRLVLADLADLADATGRFEELAELVESWQSQVVEPERARALALRRVFALRHGDNAAAADALLTQLAATYPGYVPIVAIRESDAMARGDMAALLEVFTELGEAAERGSMHGDTSGDAQPTLAAELFATAAAVAEVRSDFERARGLYARALAADPQLEPARDGLVACLERESNWDGVVNELSERAAARFDPHWRLRIAHAKLALGDGRGGLDVFVGMLDELGFGELLWMAALAISVGDASAEATALETAASHADVGDNAAELLGRAARSTELSDPQRASNLYRKALEARPKDAVARSALAALLRREQEWKALATVLREGASSGTDPRGAARAWLELAALSEARLSEPAAAAEAYREALSLVPDDAIALEGLIRVTKGAERVDALERAMASSELGSGLSAGLALARLHCSANELEEAARVAETANLTEKDLGLDTRASALIALEIAAKKNDPSALANALEAIAAQSRGNSRSEFLAAAGWNRFLGQDAEAAASLFAAARDEDPSSRSALLGGLLVAHGEDEAIAAETLAGSLEGDALAVSMLRGAGIHAAVAGDQARASTLLASAVTRAPADLSSALAFTELTDPSLAPEAAALAFARRAESASIGSAQFTLESARALASAGRLAEAGALALQLAKDNNVDPAPVSLLAAICRQGGDANGEATALIELASRIVGERVRARLLRRAAELFGTVLERPEAAAAAYWQLCEIVPNAPERTRLEEILASMGDYGSLWDLYCAEIERAEDPKQKAELLIRRARLRGDIADRHGGVRDVGRARSIDEAASEDAGSTALLAELREWIELPAGANAELACASLAERIESLVEPAAKARAYVDLATLYRDSLANRERAADAIAAARQLDPSNLEAAARAGEVAAAALAIRRGLEHGGGHHAGYQKLAAALELLGDHDESRLVREVAQALSPGGDDNQLEVSVLESNRRPLELAILDRLGDQPREGDLAGQIWEKIADAVSRENDPGPADLNLELSDRLGVRELAKQSPVAAALYERLRLHAEVYIARDREAFSLVTSANRPMIFLSPDIVDAGSPEARFRLGGALITSRERTGSLFRLEAARLATYFAAACSLAGGGGGDLGAVASEVPNAIESLQRLLSARAIGELAELGPRLDELGTLISWVRDAARRRDRFGLAVSGSIASAARAIARPGRSVAGDPAALELLAFAASERHLELRRALGLVQ